MMKKSLIVASLLLAGTSAVAQNEYFMGVGIGSGSWTSEAKVARVSDGVSVTVSESDSGGVLSILGGTIIDDKHKLSIGYSTYNTDADVDMTSIDLGYAYFIDQNSLGTTNKKWKPFVNLGYFMSTYEEDISSISTQSTFTLKTKAIMLGFGADYKIDSKQFITMGYDFSLSTSGSSSAPVSIYGTNYTIDMEVDKISRWLVTYNYKFYNIRFRNLIKYREDQTSLYNSNS